MNYEANTKDWAIGDVVIHDTDAKMPFMLMVVTGKKDDGMFATRYIVPGLIYTKHTNVSFEAMPRHAQKHYGQEWLNEMKYLHDPSLFDIEIPTEFDKYWERMGNPTPMENEKWFREALEEMGDEDIYVLYCEFRGILKEEAIDQILKDADEDALIVAIDSKGYSTDALIEEEEEDG